MAGKIDYADILKRAQGIKQEIIDLRRDFHAHPELGLEEKRTCKVIQDYLDKLGIRHETVAGTSTIGYVGEGTENIVALRADIDALPLQELNDVPYKSVFEGKMHACGHDAHAAMLLGAAKLLAQFKGSIKGQVRLLFQAAEENGRAARDMCASGAVKGAKRAFALHVASDLPVGKVCFSAELTNASVDRFTIKVKGRSSHIATPNLAADALYVASQIVIGIQAIRTRQIIPTESVLFCVGRFTSGTTYNVIAETAELEGTVRSITTQTREFVKSQIDKVASLTARMYGAEAAVEWDDIAYQVINDETATKEALSVAEGLFGKDNVQDKKPLSMGGDNFAEFLKEVPGSYGQLGSSNPNKPGTQKCGHNGHFDIDEDCLTKGTALYTALALSEVLK